MSRSFPLILVLVLVLVGAALWWLDDDPQSPPATLPEPTTQSERVEGVAPDLGEPETTPPEAVKTSPFAPEIADPGAGAAASRSCLRVAARWPDGSPARAVMISIRGTKRSQGYGVRGHRLSDDAGRAVFTGLQKGKWSVRSDRGDRKTVEYEGGEQDFVFELEGGVRVQGTVIDETAAPVPEASVWLQTRGTDWSSGRVVATCDAEGFFELDQVPPHLSLGAIARGFGPSQLLDLDVVDCRAPVVTVRLQLQGQGGSLVGTVTDTSGKAIEGAIVAIGKGPRHLDMRGERVIEHWSCRWTRSDARGRFAFAGIKPGPLPVSVRADGHGIQRTTCAIVAGETTKLAMKMPASGTISGTVTDGESTPLAGAIVRCYDREPGTDFIAGGQIDFHETFGGSYVAAARDGSFIIRNVTPGTAFVFAQPGGRIQWGKPVPFASAKLDIAPGATATWNAHIADGRTIEGIVTYRDGHAMPNVFVTLNDERSDAQHVQTNDEEGVFRFVNLEDTTYSVHVQYWDAPEGTPPLQKSGIVPDQGRVELQAPFDKPVEKAKGTVTGRVDDVGGRITNVKDARIILNSDQRWFRQDGEITNGAFRFDDVTPCRFRLTLMEGKKLLARSDWHELQPGATLDTGVLRTEPGGSVHITLARPEGTETLEPKLYLRRDERGRSTTVEMGRKSELTVDSLTPGDYRVTGYARGMVRLRGEVTVKAGTTTELSLSLRAGVPCRFEVWAPPGTSAANYTYTITDRTGQATGGEVFLLRSGKPGTAPWRPFPFTVTIPAGRYSIEFSADDHLFATATFTVRDGQEEVRVRLDLAPR